MEEKLMIKNLKELSAALRKHAAGSESITPAAWADSLDKAIETLERIKWRNVEEELPEVGQYGYPVNVLKLAVADNGKYNYITAIGYYHSQLNPWCDPRGAHTTHWAYLPELPEEKE